MLIWRINLQTQIDFVDHFARIAGYTLTLLAILLDLTSSTDWKGSLTIESSGFLSLLFLSVPMIKNLLF
jgi:hypothetical protein